MIIDLTISTENLKELYNQEASKKGDDRNPSIISALGALLVKRLEDESHDDPDVILINGVIEKPDHLTKNQVVDLFLDWVTAQGFDFGGSMG